MTATTKAAIHDELARTSNWMTITDLSQRIQAGESTIARALRKLREEGHVKADRVPNDPKGRKHWAATGTGRPKRVAAPKKRNGKPNGTSNVVSIAFGAAAPSTSPAPVAPTGPWDCPACNIKNPAQHSVCQACGAASPTKGPNMSLEQATVAVITDFLSKQKTFSAHDVTSELRDRSNTGVVNVDPAKIGTVNVSGSDVPRINHTEVRDLVHDLFTQGKMPGYDRSSNGTFIEYAPATTPTSPTVVDDDDGDDDGDDGSNYDGSSSL